MPPQLGRLDPMSDGRIMLSPRGLSFLPSAAPLLQAFIGLIRRAIARYEDAAGEPIIAAAELPELLGIDAELARRLEQLAMLDTWVLRPAGGYPGTGDLQLAINESVAFVVADVETVEQYLRLQLEKWCPDPAPPVGLAVPEQPVDPQPADPAKVMVVHGRDLQARDDLFSLLRAMGLQPIEWIQAIRKTETGAPYTGDAVEAAFRLAQAAVVLCTPDEEVLLREDLRDPDEPAEGERAWQPRPNVFFEGGIAFTRHPKRTIVLEMGKVRIASDLLGRNVIRIAAGPKWRHDFAEWLRTARCAVDTSGSDWLTTGTFAIPKLISGMERPPVLDRAVTTEGPGPIMRGIADQQW